MIRRLRDLLSHDQAAAHLTGVQLGLVAAVSLGLTLAAAGGAASAHLAMRASGAPAFGGAAPRVSMALGGAGAVTPVDTAAQPDGDVIRLQDLSPEQARLWNAANPVSSAPNPAAKPFVLKTDSAIEEARATDCMTAAVYYEAGFESVEGQQAVAQVVINRMRHPAFPKTICGVVFQGSERKTGCQFTFTCDGALARRPEPVRWAQARQVAEAALHGAVMKKVGNATHYHAVYVAPYWSPTLLKVRTIGAHIFYRWTGGSGLPPAFGGVYVGGEAKGVQVAKLDGLGAGAGAKMALTPASDVAPVVTAADAAAPAVAEARAEPAAVTVVEAPVAAPAPSLAKAEDLDWQGRPKAAATPRLAMPSGGGFGGGMGMGGF